MKETSSRIQNAIQQLQKHIQSVPFFTDIVTELQKNGAHVYIVGGIVRDAYMDLPLGDIDVEVHNIADSILERVLQQFGPCSLVGASFGVYKLYGIDWTLPRHDVRVVHDSHHTEVSLLNGRHPHVQIDIHLDIRDAARRRDLTINALMYDMQQNIIHDFFNSCVDCDRRLLRSPDVQFFADDPLRFFRVMHFVGRFDALVDSELFDMCRQMDISAISRERVEQELYKLFLYARYPSRGFRFLQDCGRLNDWFAEIAALVPVKQLPQWHPEGSAFEHTMQTLDAAAIYIRQYIREKMLSTEYPDSSYSSFVTCSGKNSHNQYAKNNDQKDLWNIGGDQKNSISDHTGIYFQNGAHSIDNMFDTDTIIVLLLAALCHDCGKAVCTDMQRLKARGHDRAGVDCARSLLQRIFGNKKVQKKVFGLVRYHMMPLNFITNNASSKAYRVLSVKLARYGVTLRLLAMLAYADAAARNGVQVLPLNGYFYDGAHTDSDQIYREKQDDCVMFSHTYSDDMKKQCATKKECLDAFTDNVSAHSGSVCGGRVALFAQRAFDAGVFDCSPQALVGGKDLFDSYPVGPLIGEMVAYAYELQVERGIVDKDVLLELIGKKYKKERI